MKLLCFLHGSIVRDWVSRLTSANWLCKLMQTSPSLTFFISKMRWEKTISCVHLRFKILEFFHVILIYGKKVLQSNIFCFCISFPLFEFWSVSPPTKRSRSHQWFLRGLLGKVRLSWRNILSHGSDGVWVPVAHFYFTEPNVGTNERFGKERARIACVLIE